MDDPFQNKYEYGIVAMTWIFFVIQTFVMQIVLLNFLIAEVSMTFENVNNLGSSLIYQKKQGLNLFVQKILKFYGKDDPFKALVFVAPSDHEDAGDQFGDLKEYVKQEVEMQMEQFKNEIIPEQQKIIDQCSSNNSAFQ